MKLLLGKGELMTKSQLIKDISTNKITLEEGLQRFLVISYSLENKELQNWILGELNGYSNIDVAPNYRIGISYKITYSGLNGSLEVKNIPLPSGFIPTEIREVLKETSILDGIKSIEQAVKNDDSIGRDLTDMASAIYNKVGVSCYKITQTFSHSSLQNIISTVKNKLILVLLDLEKKFGNLDDLDIDAGDVSEDDLSNFNQKINRKIFYDGIEEEV